MLIKSHDHVLMKAYGDYCNSVKHDEVMIFYVLLKWSTKPRLFDDILLKRCQATCITKVSPLMVISNLTSTYVSNILGNYKINIPDN